MKINTRTVVRVESRADRNLVGFKLQKKVLDFHFILKS